MIEEVRARLVTVFKVITYDMENKSNKSFSLLPRQLTYILYRNYFFPLYDEVDLFNFYELIRLVQSLLVYKKKIPKRERGY